MLLRSPSPNPGQGDRGDVRWVALALLAGAAAAAPLRFDFETGDLQGWRVVEGAFGRLVCDRAEYHHSGGAYLKQGRWFLSTLESPENTPNDRYLGVVESPVFRLAGPRLSLLVGGGNHPDTVVALCTLDGAAVREARGTNSQVMRRVEWDAPELVGQLVYLRVVDGRTDGWGHVTCDDFTVDGAIDEAATAVHFERRASVLGDLALRAQLGGEWLAPPAGDVDTLRAAIDDLIATFGERYPQGPAYLARLAALAAGPDDPAAFAALQREALLANPLLAEQPLLFVVRPQYLPDHHNTETLFQTGELNTQSFRGGGALKSLDLRSGEVRTWVDCPAGIARDPEVHFDGRRVVFSMRRDATDDYHLYELDTADGGVRQLTRARGVSDIDPLYLPDGDIVFSSTREPKYCMCNRHIMANLYRMRGDGAGIVQIGKSTLFEGHGALLPDGRILYDRWEYVDRNFGDAQGLWTVNPDGTNPAVYWGNNTPSPGGVIDARPIPGSPRTIATFTSCHDRPWGAIAILDRRRGLDGREPVVRTWPVSAVERVGQGGLDSFTAVYPRYEDPYPLSDRYYLCSRMVSFADPRMGIFLLDSFGNEILVHVEGPGCFDPMPLGPRPRPPVLPERRDLTGGEGRVFLLAAHRSTHWPGAGPGVARYLRVVESPEKRFWTYPAWNGQGQQAPAMNWHDFNNKRILGTVPIEPDGSAWFTLPAERFVYFQVLDDNGMMIQSMRSGTMVQAGETVGCIGCHEDRLTAPPAGPTPLALRRPPSRLEGWHGPPRLFSYAAEVQPVFDRHCLGCHDYGASAASHLVLAPDRDLVFNASYVELWRRRLVRVVGAGPAEIQAAYSWGSHASPLVKVLREGHHGVELTAEELARIITWIDLNAPYYPEYASAYPEHLAGRSPLDNTELARLCDLTGVSLATLADHNANPAPQVSFERPELSPCLAGLRARDEAAWREALAIIQRGAQRLAERPRGDLPGFTPAAVDQAREQRYQRRRAFEQRHRAALAAGQPCDDEP